MDYWSTTSVHVVSSKMALARNRTNSTMQLVTETVVTDYPPGEGNGHKFPGQEPFPQYGAVKILNWTLFDLLARRWKTEIWLSFRLAVQFAPVQQWNKRWPTYGDLRRLNWANRAPFLLYFDFSWDHPHWSGHGLEYHDERLTWKTAKIP